MNFVFIIPRQPRCPPRLCFAALKRKPEKVEKQTNIKAASRKNQKKNEKKPEISDMQGDVRAIVEKFLWFVFLLF